MPQLLERTDFLPGDREPIMTIDYEPSEFDIRCMEIAIQIAKDARDAGDNPIGAVLAQPSTGQIFQRQTEEFRQGNVEAHAEKLAYTDLITEHPQYGHDLSTWAMYSIAEPCVGCAHLVDQTNLGILHFAAWRHEAPDFFREKEIRMYNILKGSGRSFVVISGLMKAEALKLLVPENKRHR